MSRRSNQCITPPSPTSCLELTFTSANGNGHNNSDEYHFHIKNIGGQRMILNGKETDELELIISGNWELDDFLGGMVSIANKLRIRDPLVDQQEEERADLLANS